MVKKSLTVYDTWFGFYIHLKKVTLVLPYGNHRCKCVNLKHFEFIGYTTEKYN